MHAGSHLKKLFFGQIFPSTSPSITKYLSVVSFFKLVSNQVTPSDHLPQAKDAICLNSLQGRAGFAENEM